MFDDGFIDGNGLVAEAWKETRKIMNRRRLMDGGDMRNAGQARRLSGHPMRAARMGVDNLDFMGTNKGSHARSIEDAQGKCLGGNRHGLILLAVVKLIRNPKNLMLSPPRIGQREAVRFGSRGF